METVTDYFWGGSKIIADGDCSHESKRRLFLGRKAMANLAYLKSRDITLPTKVGLAKAMAFPVVMCGCESWTTKEVAAAAAAAAKSLQSCPTLCDPTDGSPPGSHVPGILQARTLDWVAIAFSNAWKWKVKVKSLSRVWLLATPWTASLQGSSVHGTLQAIVLEWGQRKLSIEELMLLNCGVGEDSRESFGLQGNPTSPS